MERRRSFSHVAPYGIQVLSLVPPPLFQIRFPILHVLGTFCCPSYLPSQCAFIFDSKYLAVLPNYSSISFCPLFWGLFMMYDRSSASDYTTPCLS
jgi:hypothetical protein